MTLRTISALSLATILLFCAFLLAQSDSTPPQAQPSAGNAGPAPTEQATPPEMTIRQTVRRVIVDVMVRDANGKPVHGLTAQDFSLSEDNQPQRVLSFDAYDFEKPSISRGPNAPPLPPNVFVNVPETPERGPLYVMLLDLVNTEVEDQMTARLAILKFIRSKPQGTRFAIYVVSDELYLAQGFTDDQDLLVAAVDGKHPKNHVPRVFLNGRNFGRADPYTLVDVLTNLGRYLDGIPGRKNLIWMAGTFPVDVFPNEEDPVELQTMMKAETNALAQAQVAVFPVSVRGVVVNCEGCMTGASPHGGVGGQSSSPTAVNPNNGNGPLVGAMRAGGHGTTLTRDQMTEEVVAENTGGRAFYSTNDVSGALEEATEDGGNYYTLTYSPPARDDNGKCHNISVQLDKSGNRLSYRRSYCRVPLVSVNFDDAPQKANASTLALPIQAGDVLQGNMKHGAPMIHDLLFSAHVQAVGGVAVATPDQMTQIAQQAAFLETHRRNRMAKPLAPVKVQPYAIDYRVLDPQLKSQAARSGKQSTLEFAVVAFDNDGKTLNGSVNDGVAESPSPANDNKSGLYRVHQTFLVPMNATSIRVGVRDRASDRMGTLEVSLPLKPEPVNRASTSH